MKKVLCIAALAAGVSSLAAADVAPITGTWACKTEFNNRGNIFVVERSETYNAGGDHLVVARTYGYPEGSPDDLAMDVTVTSLGNWSLQDNTLTTQVKEVDVNDAINPESAEANSLAQFMLERGAQQVNVEVQAEQLLFSDPASGQTLSCERSGS